MRTLTSSRYLIIRGTTVKPYSRLRAEVEGSLEDFFDGLDPDFLPLSEEEKTWFIEQLTGHVVSMIYNYLEDEGEGDYVDEEPQ